MNSIWFLFGIITHRATLQPNHTICIDPLPWCSLLFLNFSLWLDGVLPLVMDREATPQEKCFQILEEVLLSNIVPHSKLVAQLTVRTLKHFTSCTHHKNV